MQASIRRDDRHILILHGGDHGIHHHLVVGRDHLPTVAPLMFDPRQHLEPMVRLFIRPTPYGGIADQLQKGFDAQRARTDRVLIKMSLEKPFVGVDL